MITVGFARTALPVAAGVPLGGNARDDKGARGTHDPIHATVMTIQHPDRPVVLVGLDLLSAPGPLVERIRSAVRSTLALPADVDVMATHTHSGPDVTRGMGFDTHDYAPVDRWEDSAVSLIAKAAAAAWRVREPAALFVGRTNLTGVAFNRRLVTRTGAIVMNWAAADPEDVARTESAVDEELLVLRFDTADGRTLGAVMHFALHPAILVGEGWLVSADFVAGASATLSEELHGAPVLYASGALGDVNHLDYTKVERSGGFAEADRVGGLVGEAAVRAARGALAAPWVDQRDIQRGVLQVELIQRTVDGAQVDAAEVLAADPDAVTDLLDGIPPKAYAVWTLTQGRKLTPTLPVQIALLTIGTVVFVFAPFEVFSAFGLRLANAFPDLVVKVVSLANGGLGYLPTRIAFANGGYEPTLGTSTIAAGEGEALFDAVEDRLRSRFPNTAARTGHDRDSDAYADPPVDRFAGTLEDDWQPRTAR